MIGIENIKRYIYRVSECSGNTNSSFGAVCRHRGCVISTDNPAPETGPYLLVISYIMCIGSQLEKNKIGIILFLPMRHCSLRTKQRGKVAHVVTTVPLQFRKFFLHKSKFGAWCATSARKTIRTVFSKETNSSPYVKLKFYEFQASETAVGYLTS